MWLGKYLSVDETGNEEVQQQYCRKKESGGQRYGRPFQHDIEAPLLLRRTQIRSHPGHPGHMVNSLDNTFGPSSVPTPQIVSQSLGSVRETLQLVSSPGTRICRAALSS